MMPTIQRRVLREPDRFFDRQRSSLSRNAGPATFQITKSATPGRIMMNT